MAFCTNCGTNVGSSIRFCTNCGTPQAASAPANAPLLEFGEQARAPQQQSMNFSAPVMAPASSTNQQFILMLCIAQIAAPLIYVLAEAIDFISFESIKTFFIPYLIGAAIGFSPFAALAFIPKFQNDVQMKLAAAIAAAIFGTQNLIAIDDGVFWLSGLPKFLMYLSIIASVSGIALAVLLVLDLKINKSMLASMAERWRAVPGFLAVLFLVLDSADSERIWVAFSPRVFTDKFAVLSFVFFPVVVGACLLQEKYRQGAAAGLAVVTVSSMIYQMASAILNDYNDWPFITLPSILALVCCGAVIAPNSMIQQKQASVPR